MGYRQDVMVGFNFGGWLSQGSLDPGRIRSFITEDDFRNLAKWGFNAVRVPFSYKLVEREPLSLSNDGLAMLRRAVEMALAYGLRVILDLHEAPGHSFVHLDQNTLFTDPEERKRVGALWAGIARYFKKAGDEVIFELMNEACAPTAAQWQDLAGYMTAAVRSEDTRRPLVVGANMWSMTRSFLEMKPTGDERSIYTFHFYEPTSFSHQGATWMDWAKAMQQPVPYPGEAAGLDQLAREFPKAGAQLLSLRGEWNKERLREEMRPVFDFARRYDVQVFCGEFGVYGKAPRDSQLAWLKDVLDLFSEQEAGFFHWSYKNMAFGLRTDSGSFAEAPQFQNPERIDHEMLKLLRSAAGQLVAQG